MHGFWRSPALHSHWRADVLRTNLWLVPGLEVLAAIVLLVITLNLDRAAYRDELRLPSWVIVGSADAAQQILTAIATAVITVVGVVFSIILVTLTLASTQFGPRMLRNFIRDRGTQLTLGTFVATFVYAVLVLVSIGPGSRGTFVPHISVTVTLALTVADMGVLIYFIHHTATSIQLPQVIASIARDLAEAIKVQGGHDVWPGSAGARVSGPSAAELLTRMRTEGGEVRAPADGYLQFIRQRSLVQLAARADAVIALDYRPGHFLVQGHPFASVWPPAAADRVSEALGRAHITGPYRTLTQDISFGIDQLVEIAIRALSTAVNEPSPRSPALTGWARACARSPSDGTRRGCTGTATASSGSSRPSRATSASCSAPSRRSARPAWNAGGADPPARGPDQDHGRHIQRRTAPRAAGAGRHDPAGQRALGAGGGRPGRYPAPLRGLAQHRHPARETRQERYHPGLNGRPLVTSRPPRLTVVM